MAKAAWPVGIGLFCVLVIAGGVYFGVPERPKPVKRISLQSLHAGTETASFGWHADTVRIAVGSMVSPASSLIFYEDIFNYVGEKLGRKVEMVQRMTYAEVNFLLKEGRIDAAFVCSRPYVEGHREFGMELLCAPVCFGKTEYHSYFIVHKDSQIQSLEDLRGKTFAFTDPLSNSGMLVPTYTLAEMGETPESFFRRYIFTYSHDNSIRLVAEKFVDGAAVDSLIWEYLDVNKQGPTSHTRIIFRSAPCGIPPLVASPYISNELKTKLRSTFLDMHNNPRGREILKKVLIDRFTVIEDSAYESIRQMDAFMEDFRSEK